MADPNKKNSIIYCRVSSHKSAQEGESLDTQDGIMRRFVGDRGWVIVPNGKVFREAFTGRKDSRPVLDEIFEYIEDNPGKVNYFVFRNIDRFTRGGSYSYESIKKRLASHGVEMIDTYGVIQPVKNTLEHLGFEYEWSKTSPSEIAETVIANTAKAEVTNILTRMIGREIELTNQGFQIGQASDGMLNKRVIIDGKKKVIQAPDPERAKFFIEIFTLLAAGTHTDKEIVERVNAMGYRTKIQNRWNKAHEKIIGSRGGVPLTIKRLQEVICRPVYCGIICEKWTRFQPIKAQYNGLVSIETFNLANRGKVFIKKQPSGFQILYDYQPERKFLRKSRNNPLFPFKRLVLCPVCRKPFYGSCPRGSGGQVFPTYHCSRKEHEYIGIPKKEFDTAFEKCVARLNFRSDIFEALEIAFLNKYHQRKAEIAQSATDVRHAITELKIEQKAKMEAFVAAKSPVLRTQLEEEIEELQMKINGSTVECEKLDITEDDIHDFRKSGEYILEHLPELLLNQANPQQTEAVFRLIVDSIPTYKDITLGTIKMAEIFTFLPESSQNDDLVHQQGFSWNTIENTIKGWISIFNQLILLEGP